MKKYFIFFLINSTIFALILIGLIIDYNYSYKNIENFSQFNWKDFQDISSNIKSIPIINTPSGYINNTNFCNFPECSTFNNVENNWNKYIINEDVSSPITNKNNFRVISNPYDFIKYNIISPYCCEYSHDYTSSTGCTCLTPHQYIFLKNRGGNRD